MTGVWTETDWHKGIEKDVYVTIIYADAGLKRILSSYGAFCTLTPEPVDKTNMTVEGVLQERKDVECANDGCYNTSENP